MPTHKHEDLADNGEVENVVESESTATAKHTVRATRSAGKSAKAKESVNPDSETLTEDAAENADVEETAPDAESADPTKAVRASKSSKTTETVAAAESEASAEEDHAAAESTDASTLKEPPAPPAGAKTSRSSSTRAKSSATRSASTLKKNTDEGTAEDSAAPKTSRSRTAKTSSNVEVAESTDTASTTETASDSAAPSDEPTPRRRRGGRRVVRGAGAAGASLELKVEGTASARRRKTDAADVSEMGAVSAVAKKTAESAAETVADTTPDETAPSTRATRAARTASDTRVSSSDQASSTVRTRRRAAAKLVDIDEDGDIGEDGRSRTRRRSASLSEATTRRRAASASPSARDFDDERDPRASRDDRDARDIRDDRDERDARSARASRGTRGYRDEYDDYDERIFEDIDTRIDDHGQSRGSRPMTSLLFQEPVIPSTRRRSVSRDERDDEDDYRDEDMRGARSSRSARLTRDGRDGRDERDEDMRETRSTRRRSRSARAVERDARDERDMRDEEREERESRDGREAESRDERRGRERDRDRNRENEDTATESASRRSNRRLNAQERRAAAEVEQIEEDLELDDIVYAPISDEDLSEGPTRSRRRRRRSGAAAQQDTTSQHGEHDETAESDEREKRDGHDDEGDQSVTRRRRRRRGGKGEAESSGSEDQILARRSRKQQYIDEITDIEGSTRLEAKKQRRRDNRRERSRVSQLTEQDFLARRENVDRLMVVRERDHHTQISVVEDNILVEHYVSDIQEVQTVGNIYLGRVQNVLPSMEAAFVDIGQARNGVLYAGEVNWDAARLEGQPRRIELAFKSGDPVLVQVTKDPIGHKGARLTSQVTLAGRFLVLVPSGGMTGVSRKLSERERSRLKSIVSKIAPKDMGVIIRTAAEGASEDAITKDLENLVRQWERITAKRDEFLHGRRPKLLQGEPDVAIRVVRDIFNDDFNRLIVEGDKVYDRIEEYLDTMAPDLRDKLERWDPSEHEGKDVFDKWQIDSQLRKGMERQVYLPSGGSIVIDRTEAMTTIDVNTGRFIGKGKSLEETVTRCNLEASEEIARQLRLRDIGGMVMIDYVDMVMPANRDLVLRRLVECLARDRTKHQVAEVTSLGLVQMTRKRIGQGLVEAFSEECPTCKGRGFILHDQPTVSADYDDPYAMRGGDPFVKTNKHGQGTQVQVPQGSSADVKAKLAQIAAAAVAANNAENMEK